MLFWPRLCHSVKTTLSEWRARGRCLFWPRKEALWITRTSTGGSLYAMLFASTWSEMSAVSRSLWVRGRGGMTFQTSLNYVCPHDGSFVQDRGKSNTREAAILDSHKLCVKVNTFKQIYTNLTWLTVALRMTCFPFQYFRIPRYCRVLTMSLGWSAVSWLISESKRKCVRALFRVNKGDIYVNVLITVRLYTRFT